MSTLDRDELTAAVVGDGDLTADLMAGLESVDLEGLALIPDGMRHVFSFGDAFVTPADFDGIAIRAPQSAAVAAVIESFGATPVLLDGTEFDEAVANGEVGGADSSFVRAANLPSLTITTTGNLTLYPRVNTLVANADRFRALDQAVQQVLRDAAAATRDRLIADAPSDAEHAEEFCADVGNVVLASGDDVAEFEDAVTPVYEMLEADPATAELMQKIRALSREITAVSRVEACTHEPEETSDGQPGESIPFGSYVKEVDRDEEIARGLDPAVVDEFLGEDGMLTLMLEIDDAGWTQLAVVDDGSTEGGDLGTYSYDADGHWVTVSSSGGCRGCTVVLDWTFADGVLTLAAADVPDNELDDDERLNVEGEWVVQTE